MNSSWRALVAVVATILIGWFAVMQYSRGQDADDLFLLAPTANETAPEGEQGLFGPADNEVRRPTPVPIPNAEQDVLIPRVHWDYHVEIANDFGLSRAKELGRKGWELVAVYHQNEQDFRAIYKRVIDPRKAVPNPNRAEPQDDIFRE